MPSNHFFSSIFSKKGWQFPQSMLLCAFFVMLGLTVQQTWGKMFGKKHDLDPQV